MESSSFAFVAECKSIDDVDFRQFLQLSMQRQEGSKNVLVYLLSFVIRQSALWPAVILTILRWRNLLSELTPPSLSFQKAVPVMAELYFPFIADLSKVPPNQRIHLIGFKYLTSGGGFMPSQPLTGFLSSLQFYVNLCRQVSLYLFRVLLILVVVRYVDCQMDRLYGPLLLRGILDARSRIVQIEI